MRVGVALVAVVVLAACSGNPQARPSDEELSRSGGEGTVVDASAEAFALSARTLTPEERRAFSVGNNFFNDNWVTAPASTDGRDGLGPTFNAQSCSSCHFRDGRAQPPRGPDDPQRGLLLRLSGADGQPDPVYGGQLQDRSINGVPAEGTIRITRTEVAGTFADGSPYSLEAPTYAIGDPAFGPPAPGLRISPRIAPAVFGVGLLEAVPEADIVAKADPDDKDGDGISGRANRVVDARSQQTVLGRFGWKASVPTVEQQNASAFNGDIGITSSVFPAQDCASPQTACQAAPDGGDPELDDAKLSRVTFYTRTLAVPARRNVADPVNRKGEDLFDQIGCASCHTPQLRTGGSEVAALSNQVIRPFTDLLLHDLGEGLADPAGTSAADGLAGAAEWRTPPLWGIGLTKTVNRHTRFLHDGRARSLTEAVLWHGGEAAPAQERFRELSARDRATLVEFLESL